MSALWAILGSCKEAALDQSIEVAGGTVVCCPSLVYLEKPDGNVGVGVARDAWLTAKIRDTTTTAVGSATQDPAAAPVTLTIPRNAGLTSPVTFALTKS
jgi:hypothetical protein